MLNVRTFLVLLLATATIGASEINDAEAQPVYQPQYMPPSPPEPPPALPFRSGFMIGLSIGVGSISCDGCDSEAGTGWDFSIGGFINPRTALMYDVSSVVISEGNLNGMNVTNTFAAQYWVSNNLWLKGGLGVGRFILFDDEDSVELGSGTAVTGAIGYEFFQNFGSAADVQLRLANVSYDNGSLSNVSALIGYNWY